MTETQPFQQTAVGCAVHGVGRRGILAGGREFGVQVARSGTLPWLRILRLPRFGRALPGDTVRDAIRVLREVADAGGVLRVHVEGWSEDPDGLAVVADACGAEGFQPAVAPRSYGHTLWIDLAPPEDQILAGFHPTGRRHIAAPAKKGFEVRPVRDESLASRLEELHQGSFARTGGAAPRVDWVAAIRASVSHPGLIRIEGLFPTGGGGSEAVGFAMAFHHGDLAEYGFAGSERSATGNIPLLYAPTWALMRWARSLGARWWDFGGVPGPGSGQEDPRAGIADFKHYFGGTVVAVGNEWVYEPQPLLGRMAAWLSASTRRISSYSSPR